MSDYSTYHPKAIDAAPSGVGHLLTTLLRTTPLYLFAIGVKAALASAR